MYNLFLIMCGNLASLVLFFRGLSLARWPDPDELPLKQVAGSVLAFIVRYGLAGLVYDGDRR